MSLKPAVSEKDHIQGKKNAPIELVEYGDYECPYCQEAYYYIKEVQEALGDELKFVFRNFPLYNAHPHALHAATAAEAAGESGKFWEMHDILYENQEYLDDEDLVEYAEKIGLNAKVFESDFSDSKYADRIESDIESGLRSGVSGTPAFFVNGSKYDGDYSKEGLLEYIRAL